MKESGWFQKFSRGRTSGKAALPVRNKECKVGCLIAAIVKYRGFSAERKTDYAWGMALACHLSRSGHDVTVWCHSEEAAAKLTAERKMEAAFPGIQFPENIVFTHDAELAATGRDLIVFSVASSFTRSTAKLFAPS